MGKHGTLEWLPGKSLGLSNECYPDLFLGNLPMIYPFIINDPGEGTQAKRRNHATIIDHMTPPMTSAGAYGALAELAQLVDEYYTAERLDPAKLPLLQRQIMDVILVGNGAAEIIWLICFAWLRPDDAVVILGPTFGEYARMARLMSAQVVELQLSGSSSLAFPLNKTGECLTRYAPRLFFLCRPNNPTGEIVSLAQIRLWAETFLQTLFVIDEAYLDFVPSLVTAHALRLPNVVVIRSMTNAYALAGLRLGYIIAAPEVIRAFRQVRIPWSVNNLALIAGRAALADHAYLARTLGSLHLMKNEFASSLGSIGFIPLNRIDIDLDVQRVPFNDLFHQNKSNTSTTIRKWVESAHTIHHARFALLNKPIMQVYAEMGCAKAEEIRALDSARGYYCTLKLAWVIVDLLKNSGSNTKMPLLTCDRRDGECRLGDIRRFHTSPFPSQRCKRLAGAHQRGRKWRLHPFAVSPNGRYTLGGLQGSGWPCSQPGQMSRQSAP